MGVGQRRCPTLFRYFILLCKKAYGVAYAHCDEVIPKAEEGNRKKYGSQAETSD